MSRPWDTVPHKLFIFNPDVGGVTVIILGASGAGKTHLLLHIARRKLYEAQEICVWRGMHSAQAWQYFKDICIHVFRDRKVPVCDERFRKWPKLKRGVLNVIYAPSAWWRKYLFKLSRRPPLEPMSVFIDEFEAIAPSYAAEETWHVLEKLSDAIREMRKAWVNLYCATQQWIDIDYRILSKFMFRVYLPGARRMRRSPVRQAYINKLSVGQGIAEEYGALFKHFEFPPSPRIRDYISWIMGIRTPPPQQLINTGADRG